MESRLRRQRLEQYRPWIRWALELGQASRQDFVTPASCPSHLRGESLFIPPIRYRNDGVPYLARGAYRGRPKKTCQFGVASYGVLNVFIVHNMRLVMKGPATQAISFRISSKKVRVLERLAKVTDRPRSWHIEQALDSYFGVQAWQIAQIEKSIAEMDAGKGIPHEEIKKELRNWGKGKKTKRRK